MNPLGYVKEHPYLTGGFIIGAIILFMLLRGGGGSTTASDNGSSDIYALQAAAQSQQQQQQTQLAAQGAAIGGQVELAKIQSARDLSLADIASQLGLAQINANKSSTDLVNTLTANVAMKQLDVQSQAQTLNYQAAHDKDYFDFLQQNNTSQVLLAAVTR